MLLAAAYWRTDQNFPSLEDGLARLDLVYLLDNWGREGDCAVIAVTEIGKKIGAAWYRFWGDEKHSYGYISSDIPELAIAVRKEYRGKEIRSRLLDSLLESAVNRGVKKLSLSVEVENPALNLYCQHGFQPVNKDDQAWTMVTNVQE